MPKHRLRDSFKSFFESQIDPEKDEELKGTKAEIESNVQKILHVLKEEDHKDGKESVVNLIEDFHNHYQSLYERYNHLTEQLREKANGSSFSNSVDPPRKKGTKNASLFCSLSPSHGIYEYDDKADINQELEIAVSEVVDLKKDLTNSNVEKETLRKELESAYKLQAEKNQKLESYEAHKEEAREKLEAAEKEIIKVNKMHEAAKEENTSLSLKISQLEDEIKQAENKIQDHSAESSQLREKLAEKERELREVASLVQQLKDERDKELVLEGRIGKLETAVQKDEDEISSLTKSVRDKEEKIEELEKVVEGLKEEKIEAIRQLCIQMEHYRSENNELRNMVAKTGRQIAA